VIPGGDTPAALPALEPHYLFADAAYVTQIKVAIDPAARANANKQ
jgi:hypothetical protein